MILIHWNNVMDTVKAALVAIVIGTGSFANAGPAADNMGDCLVKQTTGQDRIDLVRWIMLAFSKHPDVKSVVKTDLIFEDSINRTMAELFTQLIVERCNSQARAALDEEGSSAFEIAFESLGQVAAFELMNSDEVNETTLSFIGFLDEELIEKSLE